MIAHLKRPAVGEPEGLLVLLHGRGADERDLFPLLDLLDPERRLLGVTPRGPLSLPPGGAHWYAVYVETPREGPGLIKVADRETLDRNIALAKELGATVVRVRSDKPGDGLVAFAKREGITHVVFGQTARSRWEILLKGSTLNRFLEEVRDATVQVVPLRD